MRLRYRQNPALLCMRPSSTPYCWQRNGTNDAAQKASLDTEIARGAKRIRLHDFFDLDETGVAPCHCVSLTGTSLLNRGKSPVRQIRLATRCVSSLTESGPLRLTIPHTIPGAARRPFAAGIWHRFATSRQFPAATGRDHRTSPPGTLHRARWIPR